MIDEVDYEAFVWIKDNVDADYQKAILDPWKATAFTALTEKYIYTRIHTVSGIKDKEAYNFISNGSTDTSLLRKNEISIIYTRLGSGSQAAEFASDNPDLVEVRKNIYLLK